jgi:hypothetical protein
MTKRTIGMTDGRDGSSVAQIRETMESLDWSERASAHARTAETFAAMGAQRLARDLGTDLPTMVDLGRSVEKTSHYKWFLGGPEDGSFELWLHEYKPQSLRREGHATVAHNHRFWLTSIVLRGGFTDSRFRRDDDSASLLGEVSSNRMSTGETMIIDADEIHSLSELQDGTITLVAQSAPVRSYSEVFESGSRKVYFDLEAKLIDLGESLCRE